MVTMGYFVMEMGVSARETLCSLLNSDKHVNEVI